MLLVRGSLIRCVPLFQIVALLEAEIAHLRAQLRAGPDEKDRQLTDLRRRVLVLGAQLNKAVKAKRTVDLGLGRLQDLVNVRAAALTSLVVL